MDRSHQDIMGFMEDWLIFIYQTIQEKFGDEIASILGQQIVVPEKPFPQVTMAQAVQILRELGHEIPPDKKGDIDPAGERLLGDWVRQKYRHAFFFLTDWPVSVRPFYHMRHPEQPDLTLSFDLIAHGLEISTGAQREHRRDILEKQALEKGLSLDPIHFYLDFFRYGCPPHGGFGLGLARLMMVMLAVQNIRDTVFLFRGPNRLNP